MKNTREAYNQYSQKTIRRLVAAGAAAATQYETEEELIRSTDYTLSELEFVTIGFHNPDYVVPEVEEYLRIGEPTLNAMGDEYLPSYNYAEDRPEDGVSVVTSAWLHSMKSVFFGAVDEKIAARGVWKIKGIKIPSKGGDDETLIIPMDWAVKTGIKTRKGLEREVKRLEEVK